MKQFQKMESQLEIERQERQDRDWQIIGDAIGAVCLFVIAFGMLFIGAVL